MEVKLFHKHDVLKPLCYSLFFSLFFNIFLMSKQDTTEEFSHLFPPTADNIGAVPPPSVSQEQDPTRTYNAPLAEPALKPTFDAKPTITCKAGIDYVILFRFPTTPPKNYNNSRESLETHVTAQLKSITDRLEKVSVRFQIRPGKEKGTLLILVSCPVNPIRKKYRQDR